MNRSDIERIRERDEVEYLRLLACLPLDNDLQGPVDRHTLLAYIADLEQHYCLHAPEPCEYIEQYQVISQRLAQAEKVVEAAKTLMLSTPPDHSGDALCAALAEWEGK